MKTLDYLKTAEKAIKQIQKGAFLITRAGGQINVMTIGWANIGYVWRKPMLMILVRNSRHTFSIIEKAKSFAVSIPLKNFEKELEFCGTRSGHDLDKFRECGLKAIPARKITTPILAIPGIHFECRIVYKSAMHPKFLAADYHYLYPKKDYHTLYFGEIIACYKR